MAQPFLGCEKGRANPRDPEFYGLARVFRKASDYPLHFAALKAHQVADVTDFPVGHIVFCLPSKVDTDQGWRAVIVHLIIEGENHAKMAWIHPDCLEPLPAPAMDVSIQVHRTKQRGRHTPTISIGPVDPGVRVTDDAVILDARWHYQIHSTTDNCTGKCASMCRATARNDVCFACIIEFARTIMVTRKRGFVCCERGVHRSLASAKLLEICFGFEIDYYHASHRSSTGCCQRDAHSEEMEIIHSLRSLPKLHKLNVRALADILKLPA